MSVPTSILTLSNPAAKVLLPLAAIAVTLVLSRVRGLSPTQDLALVRPPLRPLLLWLILALSWMLLTDFLLPWRGPFNFIPWQAQPLWVSLARVLGVAVLGPIAEELVVRGAIFSRLRAAGLPVGVVVAATAAGWSLLHIDYTSIVIAIIFGFGLLLGLARHYTRSLWVPILMHISWNLYAVW
ncbi:CPBP family intramembrane glutamic endopeptidase [Hymenobacter volaticus]|uniref:CPBP family intramembrane metalloprotease n=1 Tax=Hymenobacter volaticus TaxID=2932254 RepID=A0ABY4GCZ9_9BACT|nr:CPBP family intramembrane glutamic endopeptidase [Hymenobacter volaticus]UOQ68768.1 CPBP family intramembrane metalloprotease [Hymenobacter volaticus]